MVSEREDVDAGLRALSDATRRNILGLLKQGELSVLEIAERFPMSRPAISKHLRILKEAGLVLETPAGRQRLYTLEIAPLQSVQDWLAEFSGVTAAPVRGAGGSTRRPMIRRTSAANEDWRVW